MVHGKLVWKDGKSALPSTSPYFLAGFARKRAKILKPDSEPIRNEEAKGSSAYVIAGLDKEKLREKLEASKKK